MKGFRSKDVAVLSVALLLVAGSAVALAAGRMGPGPERGCLGHQPPVEGFLNKPDGPPFIPDLTEEQEEQLQKIRIEHLKVMLPLRNQLAEKEARLRTLSTADDVDMKKINQTIEEIGEIRVQMMKQRAVHQQEIRKLLTEKQRVFFDSHPPRQHRRAHKGM